MKKKKFTNKTGQVRELTSKDIHSMRPANEILPIDLVEMLPKRKPGERGLQKHPTKIAVTIRYSPDVLGYFKTTGAGWQSRMNDALKEWIIEHTHAA
ncbi:MAG: BrnA antitoxin family protein [Gammaproteobacteria bacterium]